MNLSFIPLIIVFRNALSLGLILYYTQLGLNFVWSPLFFGQHQVCRLPHCTFIRHWLTIIHLQVGLALVDSVLLTATTCWMTVSLHGNFLKNGDQTHLVIQKLLDRPTDARATYFLLPYCAWLGFATYLNAGTWWLNKNRGHKRL